MTEPEATGQTAFISYSHRDADVVVALFGLLRSMGSVFLDRISLVPGDRWPARIEDAITSCSVFLLFWCEHSAASAEVAAEYRLALRCRKRIVPVLLDITALPEELQQFQWVDLSKALNVHLGVGMPHQELGRTLRALEGLNSLPELNIAALDLGLLRASFS